MRMDQYLDHKESCKLDVDINNIIQSVNQNTAQVHKHVSLWLLNINGLVQDCNNYCQHTGFTAVLH